jgi:hypothetical protein
MEFDEELLRQLGDDLHACREYLRQVSSAMRKGEVSKYPIFVAHSDDVDLGVPIIHKAEMDLNWNFSASHLEDFVNRKIVLETKVEEFKKAYRDPAQFMCIFLMNNDTGHFVFIPFDLREHKAPNSNPELN